jgi:nicotinate-nucleotide adenylyltransferase
VCDAIRAPGHGVDYHERMSGVAHGRVAFFGGSFDPPHSGHLAVARAARRALHLDVILFAPVGAQPLKPLGSTAEFPDRVAMTELAIAGEPGFAVSLADAPNPEGIPNYTIDTLLDLRDRLPKGGALFCLMGADSFLGLGRWRRGADIPFVAPLIVASRPGEDLHDLAAILPGDLSVVDAQSPAGNGDLSTYTLRNSSGATTPFYLLAGLHVEISASEIRQQVHAALGRISSGHDLLPAAVSEYIASHNLYR